MSGTHLVTGDYRWGKNPLRSFPASIPQRQVAGEATCRWESPDNSPGKGAIVVVCCVCCVGDAHLLVEWIFVLVVVSMVKSAKLLSRWCGLHLAFDQH
ncbi:hypothetical protein Tco_0108566 [Tanacetum coccineum]